jgi:hypothetical protein
VTYEKFARPAQIFSRIPLRYIQAADRSVRSAPYEKFRIGLGPPLGVLARVNAGFQ